jgi:hypothetical protein
MLFESFARSKQFSSPDDFLNFVLCVVCFHMHFVFISSQILTANCTVLHMSLRQEAKPDGVIKKSDASLCHTRGDMTGGV